MENTISEKIKAVVDNLLVEINTATKDYVNEKISLKEKREQVKASNDVADFRILKILSSLPNEVTEKLKADKANELVIRRVKNIINDCL